jgi:hypothetical protein
MLLRGYGGSPFVGEVPFSDGERDRVGVNPPMGRQDRRDDIGRLNRMSEKGDDEKGKYLVRRRETFERGEYLARDGGFRFLRRETSFEVVYDDEREKLKTARRKWLAKVISAAVSIAVAISLFLYAIFEHVTASWIWEKFLKGLM